MEKEVYQKEVSDILLDLDTQVGGLYDEQVNERQRKYGPNRLEQEKKTSALKIFFSQFKDFIVMILLAALAISLFFGEKLDAVVISVILILNAFFGFIQEYRAEKVVETLKKLTALKCRVYRRNNIFEIPAEELVPGDIIILAEGDKVPADARIIESYDIHSDESLLTGESVPVRKNEITLTSQVQIGEQKNMLFAGTTISKGKGKAVVTTIGMKTEIGKIACLIKEVKEEITPLQKKLNELGEWLGVLTLVICGIIFVVSTIKNGNLFNNFIIALSLAVAAVPEGLPAVVTISLSLGVKRMAKKNVLVRKLPAVESLGSTDVICSDKTGTFTQNVMTVTQIYANNKIIDITSDQKHHFYHNNEPYDPKEIENLLLCGVLCNDAYVSKDESEKIIGDPTEKSLFVSAKKARMHLPNIIEKYPRKTTVPFDSNTKRMTTVNTIKEKPYVFMKGAPEVVIKLCTHQEINGKKIKLTKEDIQNILDHNSLMAKKALRTLAFAYKEHDNKKVLEDELVFLGLQGMIDPPRDGVAEAVAKCHDAGIKVVMITGDHAETAVAIGESIGLIGKVLTGVELERMTSIELENHVESTAIYARVTPEHKLRIVEALQHNGHVVAMTGDGVNDAPALKKADIGVAMGSGTDVAKEASKMIITDDNFVSIVNAVEEGRKIYDNIKKFVTYLVSFNIAEVLLIFFSVMLSLPLPLIAVQILWLNLVTDGLPALALGVDPASGKIMKRKPRIKSEKFVTKHTMSRFVLIGGLAALATLYIYILMLKGGNIEVAQTAAFTALVLFEIAGIQMIRSEYELEFFSNWSLILACVSSLLLQLAVVYTPLSHYFNTSPLGFLEWLIIATAAIFVLAIYHIISFFMNKIIKVPKHSNAI